MRQEALLFTIHNFKMSKRVGNIHGKSCPTIWLFAHYLFIHSPLFAQYSPLFAQLCPTISHCCFTSFYFVMLLWNFRTHRDFQFHTRDKSDILREQLLIALWVISIRRQYVFVSPVRNLSIYRDILDTNLNHLKWEHNSRNTSTISTKMIHRFQFSDN